MSSAEQETTTAATDADPTDVLTITPLGAGAEVGRSCIILRFKSRNIMLDCGVHPAFTGLAALPFFDEVDPGSIDVILISHFHLDHAAALPYFMEKTTFKGKVFMTHPTKAIYKWMLSDYVRVTNAAQREDQLYSDADLERSFANITAIDYHQTVEVNGIRFTALNAGHVLGAAMFVIEVDGARVLYTGDYSREEDRHLMAAESPKESIDVLVVESTYGVQSHQPRHIREGRFTKVVHDIVSGGGRCLIPVFALGRAQELLLILDEYWQARPELHRVPVYYASSLAKKCMAIYQTYVNMMNDNIKGQVSQGRNPFNFKHIQNLRHPKEFRDQGPCVMMASPAMLQSGFSRELFEAWCGNRKNGIIIPGYVVEGTLGKHIMSEPREVESLTGAMLPLRMTVEYISFSAHVDFAQNSAFIEEVKAPNVVLVHGEATEMGRLRGALQHRYQDKMRIFTPRNCESVEIVFQGKKYVKVVGKLVDDGIKAGDTISGVLVKRGFEYMLMDREDLSKYTPFKEFVLRERLTIPSKAAPSLVEHLLGNLFGRQQVWAPKENVLQISEQFRLEHRQQEGAFVLEWVGNSLTDLIADTIIGVILSAETSRVSVKATLSTVTHKHTHDKDEDDRNPLLFLDVIKRYLEEQFGHVEEALEDASYVLRVEGRLVKVSMEDLTVSLVEEDEEMGSGEGSSASGEEEDLREVVLKRVQGALERVIQLIRPPCVI